MKKYTHVELKKQGLPIVAAITATIFFLMLPSLLTAQATWQQSNGPSGGYTQYVSGGSGGTVYTLTLEYDEDFGNDYRLARSSDEGLNWEKLPLIEGLSAIIGVDNSGALFINADGAMLRSSDNGNSWTQVHFPIFGNAYLLQDSDSVLYTYGNDLLLSEDGGLSWVLKADNNSSKVTVNSAGHLIKEQYGFLWISYDRGTTWEEYADIGPLLNMMEATALTTNAQDEIFVVSQGTGVIKVSSDGNSVGLVNDQFTNGQQIISTVNGVLVSLAQYDSIWVSHDNGANWQFSAQGKVSYITSRLNTDSAGNIYVGTAEGVMKSDDDGESWALVNEVLRNATAYSIVYGNDSVLLAATSYRVLRSADGGNTWQQIVGVTGPRTVSNIYIMNDGSFYYVLTDNSGSGLQYLFRSEDGGTTWSEMAGEIQLYDMVLHPDGDLFMINSTGLLVSSDNGNTWELVNTGQEGFSTIAVDTAGNLYATLWNGLLMSGDEGLTWEQIAPEPAGDVEAYYYLTVTSTGTIYLSTLSWWGGNETWDLYRLDNGDWTNISPFGESMYTDFHVDQYGALFMSTFYGLFRSENNGDDWDLIAENGDYWVPAVTTDPQGRIYASYTGRAVWISDTWVSSKPLPTSTTNAISIYPNPTSTTFNINYKTNAHAITARLFNIHGKMVRQMNLSPTNRQMDVSDLPAGVYTLQVDDDVVKVMVW